MTTARQGLGRLGEELAAAELARRGWTVMARNVRVAGVGELDIVARDGNEWVFVEVRCRRGTAFGTPEESVTPRKLARLFRAAAGYLNAQGLPDVPWRLALVAVELGLNGVLRRVELIDDIGT